MSRGSDAAARLERALLRSAAVAGIELSVLTADWTRWASATFTGARHELRLGATPSARLDAWLVGLPEHEFDMREHLVADLTVTAAHRRGDRVEIALEVLTVEDR